MEWWFPFFVFIITILVIWGVCYALLTLAGEFQNYVNKKEDIDPRYWTGQ